jgi:protein-S-isoprenylcysteine O-methyltransferase Ste14
MIEEMEASGHWLFRWRSYLPILTFIFLFIALQDCAYPFGSQRWARAWELSCLAISLSGFGVRMVTVGFTPKGTSGRNTKKQTAATLNTTGMYSIVRNPLYLGNFLVCLGLSLFLYVWWCPVIYLLLFFLYYERIVFAEEVFLRQKFDTTYMEWATKTPVFLPRFSLWIPPAVPFNFCKVCRHEHQTLFGITSAFYGLEIAQEYYLGEPLLADIMWNIIGGLGLLLFITARILRKYTSLLKDKKPDTTDKFAQVAL